MFGGLRVCGMAGVFVGLSVCGMAGVFVELLSE